MLIGSSPEQRGLLCSGCSMLQARFKYPPHWVPLPMLYDAMSAVDPTTGKPRGFLRLAADARQDSVLFTLDIRSDGWWRDAEKFIQQQAPLVLKVREGLRLSEGCQQGAAGWGVA